MCSEPRQNLDWRWKIIRFSRQNIQNFHQVFFCEFRIKVPSKNQLLRSRWVCGSELSQSWACAERDKKRVSDLRAGLRKRNKQKNVILNWVLPIEISVHSWSEKQKLFGMQKSSRSKFSEIRGRKITLFWWRIKTSQGRFDSAIWKKLELCEKKWNRQNCDNELFSRPVKFIFVDPGHGDSREKASLF